MSAWIKMLGDGDADADLQAALDLARTPHGTVDNVMRAHSLRPATMRGHAALYRAVLHDDSNTLPAWFQETLGSYGPLSNDGPYALANRWANARHLMADEARADAVEEALRVRRPQRVFSGAELALLVYAEKLTLRPGRMARADIDALKSEGVDDGKILETNQIVAYFNYVNRCLNGLGVTTDGDVVGYYARD